MSSGGVEGRGGGGEFSHVRARLKNGPPDSDVWFLRVCVLPLNFIVFVFFSLNRVSFSGLDLK